MITYIISAIVCIIFSFSYRRIEWEWENEPNIEYPKKYTTHRIKFPIWGWVLYLIVAFVPIVNILLVMINICIFIVFRFMERDTDYMILGMTPNDGYKRYRSKTSKFYKTISKIVEFLNKKI